MKTGPDGVEVVASLPEGADPGLEPLLILDRLEEYLDFFGFGSGPLAWDRVGDGQSNITYRLRRGSREFALRRGPRPPHPPSTHDMTREATIQRMLRTEGVPVPEVLAICDDSSVIGVPFYLMNWLDGFVLTDALPPTLVPTSQRKALSEQLVIELVQLHSVNVERGPIAGLGKPEGYLERQVRRFGTVWEQVATRDLPDVARLADWLNHNRPRSQTTSVVHGDYRLGNIMFHPVAPARPLAILDWEMATLGDPLADLGYLTATYSDRDSTSTPLHLSPVTALPGFLCGDELIRLYADHSSLDLSALAWYQTFALWKAAVFCEAIYSRWRNGERPSDTTFGPALNEGVPALLEAADSYRRRL